MAIYTGGMRQKDEASAAAERIAAQQAKAEKGESKRKGRAGIFGKLAGMGIGHVAGLALAGVTGGLVNPLTIKLAQAAITGGSAWLGKAGAHQATTGKWGKKLKTSGQVKKIEAGGKYGYGREEAKTLSEALVDERTSKEDLGTLAGGIGGSFAADIAGDYAGNLTKILKGDKGTTDVMSELLPEELDASSLVPGGEGAMETLADIGQSDAGDLKDIMWKQKELQVPLEEQIPGTMEEWGSPPTQEQLDRSPYLYDFLGWEKPIKKQEGGQVPQQQQLMQLLALAQMQQQQEQTAYSGTALEEEQQQSSIADHFASQGKTLAGNNTQSLSQMLGR